MRIPRLPILALVGLSTVLLGCSETDPGPEPPATTAFDGPSSVQSPPRPEVLRPDSSEGSPSAEAAGPRVVFLGTSLTEGLGLPNPSEQAWPARVGVLASSEDLPVEVVNAGLGGETSAGALRRLEWVLRQEPDVIVIETGANDGLRALSAEQLEENLNGIVARVRDAYPGIGIVLVQMEAPPNLGADYQSAFRQAYGRVAERWDTHLTPFLLQDVAGIPSLNQADGIHPTPEGHERMANIVWPTIREALAQ